MKKLSAIIVTYNSEKDIYDCLSSIFQNNNLEDELEVIVVDNNSNHFAEMKQKIREQYADTVTIIQNTKNGGYGQGNNIGIRIAQSPYVAIINPDIRFITPIFKQMVQCLENDDRIAMCSGKQYGSNMLPFTSFFSIFTLPWWFGRPLEYVSRRILDHYFFQWEYLSGAFFIMRKDIINDIGLFDENIFMYAEENDIHYRLRKKYPKMRAMYYSQFPYQHLAESREFSPNRIKKVYSSNGYFFTKNQLSAKSYWKGQIKLNKMLKLWYSFFLSKKTFLQKEMECRNDILRALINESST